MVLHVSICISNTGNVNADFKLLTHNRYSVLNGHFARPSSLKENKLKRNLEIQPQACHIHVAFKTVGL